MYGYIAEPAGRRQERGMKLGRCPKCRGNLFLEADVTEGLLLSKCLQCGLIESYFWLERSTRSLVLLSPETEPPDGGDG